MNVPESFSSDIKLNFKFVLKNLPLKSNGFTRMRNKHTFFVVLHFFFSNIRKVLCLKKIHLHQICDDIKIQTCSLELKIIDFSSVQFSFILFHLMKMSKAYLDNIFHIVTSKEKCHQQLFQRKSTLQT